MTTKYPPTERVTAGRLNVGDEILIRDRRSDQPYRPEDEPPFAAGIWTVTKQPEHYLSDSYRRRTANYRMSVEHPGQGPRVIDTSAVQRFNRVIG